MAQNQLQSDKGESRPNRNRPPDDNRKPGETHLTSKQGRARRDGGIAETSPKIKDLERRFAD